MNILYSEKAEKQLKKIDKGSRQAALFIMNAIEAYGQNPTGNFNIKMLKGKYGALGQGL